MPYCDGAIVSISVAVLVWGLLHLWNFALRETLVKKRKTILAMVADEQGEVFEHPDLLLAGMNGTESVRPQADEMIPMPEGSRLFTIPETPPIGYDRRSGKKLTVDSLPKQWGGGHIQAVSAFLTPGYTRTLLPAAEYQRKGQTLPLWSYTAVGWCVEEERFYVAAAQVDRNTQWQPDHFDDRKLDPLVRKTLAENPGNRLIEQLSRCALDYHCFAAKNLFFRRWEAPLPSSPTCNSRCVGCISLQESDCCPASQERLTFVPTVQELCEVAVPHLMEAENAIVSFGQGCEGDPIMQADVIAEAVAEMRRQTERGTINFNSNASLPDAIDKLAAAGVDSIRVSLNSAQEALYNAYYRPRGYRFADVVESLKRARSAGLYVMLNYLVFPGVSDRNDEIEALAELVEKVGVDMIQMRNLSLDPTIYLNALNVDGRGVGMLQMLREHKARFPKLQYGYFNRTRENFFPSGYESEWPVSL
jgi:molybdenum cofactor biosynthesis enzyme MoaA